VSLSHSFLDFPKEGRGRKGARIDIKMDDLSNRMVNSIALSDRCFAISSESRIMGSWVDSDAIRQRQQGRSKHLCENDDLRLGGTYCLT